MKHSPFKLIGIVLLGGLIGLPVIAGSKEVGEIRADDTNSVVFTNFSSQGESNGGEGSKVSFSSNDVTVSSGGGYSTNGVLRVYSGKKLTITSKNYKIGSIDFDMDSEHTDSSLSNGVKDINNLTWSHTMSAQTRFKTITVTFATSDATLTSLEVDSETTPKSLEAGKAISYSGVKVNGIYSDSETYNVANKCEFSPSEGTVLTDVGPQVVTVTYKATNTPTTTSGEDVTTTFTVSVTQGEKPTVFTKASSISAGDQVIFVNDSASKAAKSSLTSGTASKQYLDTTDVSVSEDKVNVYSTDGVGVYTVEEGAISNTYAFKNASNKYLSTYAIDKDGLKFVNEKDQASSWTLNLDAASNRIKSNIANQAFDSQVYLKYNVNTFRAYKASSALPEPSIYKYSSGAEKISVQSTATLLEESTISLQSEVVGFTPTSYSWTVQDSTYVEIVGSSTGSSVQIKGLVPGSTNVTVKANNSEDLVATCVVTVIAKKDAIIENGEYFITDFTGTHVLNTDLEDIGTPDYTDSTKMWSIVNNGLDGDTYSISSGSNYLFHNPLIKNSSLDLSSDNSKYWVVTKNEDDSFTFSYSETGNTLSCNPGANTGTWFAYASATGTQDHIKLLKAGNFESFEIEKLPTTKEYFVGDALKPLNSKVNAIFDNGAKVDVTNKIVWEPLTAGTKAYGKLTLGGQERTVEMDGIKVFKGDASTFVIDGLMDNYALGEKLNKDFLSVQITYKLSGSENITKTLTKDDYVITPERIAEDTTSVRIALAKDPTVYYEKSIEVKESPYVAANYVGVGDVVTIGTLGYNPYEITGGVELAYKDSKFTYSNFGNLPRGEMSFEVGKSGSYYTLKDVETGYYLKGDNSAFTFNKPDTKSVYAKADGHYEFNVPVIMDGTSYLCTMKTTTSPDFSYSNVFSSMDYVKGYSDYIYGISDLENNKLSFVLYTAEDGYAGSVTAEVNLSSWSFKNGVFQYALETSSTLPDECLFTMSYDEDYEEWSISSKPHQDKQLYFNKDGKFGFYTKGSTYTPVMLFRDNDKPLQSTVTSLSVSFYEGMDVVGVNEEFPWTSSLIVKANYPGGASKIIPVGGYSIIQMPDTSKVGKATGKIAYGQNGHMIEKEFVVTVKGHTQAFDVVCKDPILVGEIYQAHLGDDYVPPVDEPIKWSVSDPTLASIDQEGNVTGIAPGYVDVIATSFDGTYSDFEHIRIYKQVKSVTLSDHSLEIEAGESFTLSATVLPSDASNKNVTYRSLDPTIAYVNEKTGVVTGVKQGETTIVCEAQNQPEKNYDVCTVKVNQASIVHVTSISLNTTYAEVELGKTFQLSAIFTPSNAAVKEVIWESNHDNIATVDSTGKITGKDKGECQITATSVDGGFTATCTIKVKKEVTPIDVTGISLNTNKVTLNADASETFTLVGALEPAGATGKITYSSNKTEVATVDENTGVITAVSNGTATITATCNGHSATCVVTVTTSQVIEVESIELNKESIELNEGEKFTLKATILPEDATETKVTWYSSDETVAKVSSKGVVTAIGEGECEISAFIGDLEATCEVTVIAESEESDESIEVDGGTIAAVGGGVVATGVGLGCGIGIPVHKKHKKILK